VATGSGRGEPGFRKKIDLGEVYACAGRRIPLDTTLRSERTALPARCFDSFEQKPTGKAVQTADKSSAFLLFDMLFLEGLVGRFWCVLIGCTGIVA